MRQRCPEPDNVAGRRRRGDQSACSRSRTDRRSLSATGHGGVVITEAGTIRASQGSSTSRRSRRTPASPCLADQGPTAGCACAADPAAAGRLSLPRPRRSSRVLVRCRRRAAEAAAFMADSQSPVGRRGARRRCHGPAWKSKPSWYLVATEDRMIPPRRSAPWPRARVQRSSRYQGSHAIYVSQPGSGR